MSQPVPPACQLRASSESADRAVAYARQQRIEIGRPLSFDEQYPGATALENFAAALLAEILNGLRLRAKKQRLELDRVEGVVKVWLHNPLTVLDVVGEEGDPSVQTVSVKIFASTLEPEDAIQTLLREVLARSPLCLTLAKAATLETSLQVTL